MNHTALPTDLYQLTMAYGYWKEQIQDREAIFHLFFRKASFCGETAIACGIETVREYLTDFRFNENELRYLESSPELVATPL